MRVTENAYGGGSLDRGSVTKNTVLLAPIDLSDENS